MFFSLFFKFRHLGIHGSRRLGTSLKLYSSNRGGGGVKKYSFMQNMADNALQRGEKRPYKDTNASFAFRHVVVSLCNKTAEARQNELKVSISSRFYGCIVKCPRRIDRKSE